MRELATAYHAMRRGALESAFLDRYPAWPVIKHFACELFAHSDFTARTWKRLEDWLLAAHNGDREAVFALPQAVVAERLREAAKAETTEVPPKTRKSKLRPETRKIIADLNRGADVNTLTEKYPEKSAAAIRQVKCRAKKKGLLGDCDSV
jgi:hypothetical protein